MKNRSFADKLYALRSTTLIEKDPFLALGNQKLLYIKHVFSTGVGEWKSLFPKSSSGEPRGNAGGSDAHYPSSSVATSREGTPPPPPTPKRGRSPSPISTPRPHQSRKGPGQSARLVSPDSSPSSRVAPSMAPWANGFAPHPPSGRPGRGGSLLDQMLEAQSNSSRASSPGSDDTVGPSHQHQNQHQNQRIVIPIDANEGSVGGSPPSSDSDRPSVAVPHSARKHVRRPVSYRAPEQDDDTASEYSSVSAATTATTSNVTSFTGPATRSSFHIGRENPLLRARRPARSSVIPTANNPNQVPLGTRVASSSSRIPWSERDSPEASGSRGPGGFKWSQDSQAGPSSPAGRRTTQEYKVGLYLLQSSPS